MSATQTVFDACYTEALECLQHPMPDETPENIVQYLMDKTQNLDHETAVQAVAKAVQDHTPEKAVIASASSQPAPVAVDLAKTSGPSPTPPPQPVVAINAAPGRDVTVPVQPASTPGPSDVARRILDRRYAPGQIIELRAPSVTHKELGKVVYSGLYTDRDKLIEDIRFLTNETDAPAIYTNLQQIKLDELYQKAVTNNIRCGRNTTGAEDIQRYRQLLIDVDTNRPKEFTKSSSTDAEKAEAFKVTEQIVLHLQALGINPDLIDSGNSYHVVFAIDLEANAQNELLVKSTLEGLAAKFDNAHAKVDTSVYDRPRVCKLPGTKARKGANTPDRPHRWSGVIAEGDQKPVALDMLLQIANLKEAPSVPVQVAQTSEQIRESMNAVRGFLDWGGFQYSDEKAHAGGLIVPFVSDCPFDHSSGHHANEAHAGASAEGKFTFKCQHDSCSKNSWKQFRAKVEEVKGEPYKLFPKPSKPGANVLDAVEGVQDFQAQDPTTEIGEFDPSVITGIYAEFVELIRRGTTLAPQYAFLVAKTIVGALLAGKIQFEDLDCDPRFQAALIGETGAGKGTAWRRAYEIIKAWRACGGIKVTDSVDSGAGLKDMFFDSEGHASATPVLCYIDEMVSLGNKAAGNRNPSILDAILELADSTSVSRVKAGMELHSDIARLSTVMCGQNGDVFARALTGRTELGAYDRLTPEFSRPVEPGPMPPIDREAATKFMDKLTRLVNYMSAGKLSTSAEATALLEEFWKTQPAAIRRKVRLKRNIQIDAYMQAIGQARQVVQVEDMRLAILPVARQLVIRRVCFGSEIPDRVGYYLSKIKVFTEEMRRKIAAGVHPSLVAMSRRDFEKTTNAVRDNEEHIFERAWKVHEPVHLKGVTLRKANGQEYRKFLPVEGE